MDLHEIATLCEAPFDEAKPALFRGLIEDPQEFFGELHILQVLRDPCVVGRTGIFRNQKYIDPQNHPGVNTFEGVQRYRAQGGTSVTFRGVQRLPGPVRDVCRALSRSSAWAAVHAVAMETPEGEQALQTHWDINPVLAVQTRGRKRWDVYTPLATTADEVYTKWRTGGQEGEAGKAQETQYTDFVSGLTADDIVETVVLEPGDAYFVPAGWPHGPVALGGSSLHVSICPLPERVYAAYGNEDHVL